MLNKLSAAQIRPTRSLDLAVAQFRVPIIEDARRLIVEPAVPLSGTLP